MNAAQIYELSQAYADEQRIRLEINKWGDFLKSPRIAFNSHTTQLEILGVQEGRSTMYLSLPTEGIDVRRLVEAHRRRLVQNHVGIITKIKSLGGEV